MRNQPFLVLNTMRIANIAHFPVLFAELFHEKLEYLHQNSTIKLWLVAASVVADLPPSM